MVVVVRMNGLSRHHHIVSGRWLLGLALLTWGATLAVGGLGLASAPVGRLIDVYWPLLFMAWAVLGIIESLVRGRGGQMLYVLVLLVAAAFQASHLHIGHLHGWTIFWAVVILAVGLEALTRRRPRSWRRDASWSFDAGGTHGFHIGDLDVGGTTVETGGVKGESGESGPRQHTLLIGDIRLDLSDQYLPNDETRYDLSGLIGDITVLVPHDLPVQVTAEVQVGDIRLFGQKASGFGRQLSYRSPGYDESVRKVLIDAHLWVGDIRVERF
jgi:lia operon protein LiaF